MARTRRVRHACTPQAAWSRVRPALPPALAAPHRFPALSVRPHSPTSPAALTQKKKRTHLPDSEDPAKKGQPKSFVFRRGRHGALLRDLEKDLRKVRPGAAGLPCVMCAAWGRYLMARC